ncbi:hypothetical protein [Microbacterium sp. CH1]|uniref:hypothetical protein n=1 Tax=Microbacterium sp. CH1 TaxID=1770208 RepID=UPI000786F681|nr:hypothetical protein [Microbacterium sp. CH1]KYJ96944.1 hypothetical protein AUV07_04125 [Microbacterium sp. CH1]
MDARTTRRGVPHAVLWGGIGALAWAALTVLTGGGSAHADEQPKGPLDNLTSVVSETVTAVTKPVVNDVVAPVVNQVATPVVQEVVAPVVHEVVAPVVTHTVAPVQEAAPAVVETVTETVTQVPVVGDTAAPVLEAVAETTETVVEPVTDVLGSAPVSQITAPVLDLVGGLPLVGGIVVDSGAIDLVENVVGVVDGTTGLIGGVVEETVPPVVDVLTPQKPAAPQTPEGSVPAGATTARDEIAALPEPAPAPSASPSTGQHSAFRTVASFAGPVSAPHSSDAGAGDAAPVPLGAPPAAPAAPASYSATSAGGSTSAPARLSEIGATPLRAWERAAGARDDALPGAPVADTDVSPD